jgi:hypothetical protein
VTMTLAGSITLPANPPDNCLHKRAMIMFDFWTRYWSIFCADCLIETNFQPEDQDYSGKLALWNWRAMLYAEIIDNTAIQREMFT